LGGKPTPPTPFLLHLNSPLLATFYTLLFIDYIHVYPRCHPPTHATHATCPTNGTTPVPLTASTYITYCMYIYIYTHIYIQIHIYDIDIYVHIHIHTHTHTHTHTRTHTHTHTHTHTRSEGWVKSIQVHRDIHLFFSPHKLFQYTLFEELRRGQVRSTEMYTFFF
jgi:hypothetical protein